MNRSRIIIIFICTIVFTFTEIFGKNAAKFRIVKTIQITNDGEYYMEPKLSPDGSMVVFKGRKGGLFIRNADGTGSMVTILAKKGMHKYIWSPDSKQIAFDVFTSEKGRKKMELHLYDMHSKTSSMIREKGQPFRLTQWTNEGIEVKRKIKKGNQKKGLKTVKERLNIHLGSFELKKSPFAYPYYDQIDGKHFVIVEDGNGNVLSKIRGYILPIMSPQNDKFLATRSARTYVLNLSGEILTDLGYADNEMWSEDGELIIYQIGEYGGWEKQAIIGSELYVINIDGTGKNQLTDTPDIIEMSPQWSSNALKITYSTNNTGKIFVSELEYEE